MTRVRRIGRGCEGIRGIHHRGRRAEGEEGGWVKGSTWKGGIRRGGPRSPARSRCDSQSGSPSRRSTRSRHEPPDTSLSVDPKDPVALHSQSLFRTDPKPTPKHSHAYRIIPTHSPASHPPNASFHQNSYRTNPPYPNSDLFPMAPLSLPYKTPSSFPLASHIPTPPP